MGHTNNVGYLWKLCPFSYKYKEKYTDQGWDGNSNYQFLPVSGSDVTSHTVTSGTLVMKNYGGCPGWSCTDLSCGFFIKYGKRYFEV